MTTLIADWWPQMLKWVNDYVTGCDWCKQTKVLSKKLQGLFKPNKISKGPQQIIICNLITDFSISEGMDSIFIVVN